MALALTAFAAHHELRFKEIIVKAIPSGNYVTGGDTANLTLMTNPLFIPDALFGFPGVIQDYEVLTSPAGYQGNLIPGTGTGAAALATWLLEVFQTGAALSGAFAQVAAGAYPAGLLTPNFFLLRFRGPKGRI